MKICFFTGDVSSSGGTERVLSNLLNYISINTNYEIHILSLRQRKENLFFYFSNQIKFSTLYKRNEGITKKPINKIIRLRKFINKNNIDILIDVDVMLHFVSLASTMFTKTKLIDWDHFSFFENLGSKRRDWARKSASYFSDAIVAITKIDQINYQSKLNPRCPIYQIYNPTANFNNNFEYSKESKLLLSAGRLTKIKGFDFLIKVAKLVFEKHPHWKWFILGDGEDREKLQNKINSLKLNKNLILKGNVSDIDKYYKQASIFVLTSRNESFGLVLTEAKSYNLPCISFACMSGPPEIILDNVNGYLINPFDIELMSKKICKLIDDPELRVKFSKNAKNDTEKFSPNIVAEQWIGLFQELKD